MLGQQADPLRRGEPQEGGPQQRTAREIERAPRLLRRQPPRLGLPRAPRQGRQIDRRGRGMAGGAATTCAGSPAARREAGAQRLVAADDLGQGRRQRRGRQRPLQPHRARQVVGRAPGLQLVEEPEPLLREGQRQLPACARWRSSGGSAERPAPRPIRAASAATRRAPRTGSAAAAPPPAPRAPARPPASPAASGRRGRRSRRRGRPARRPEHLGPRSRPAISSTGVRGASRRRARGASSRARAGPGGRPCRSASAAARRGARRPPAPCAPAGGPRRKARSSPGPPRRRRPRRPPAPVPARAVPRHHRRLPHPGDARAAPPRSPRARCGSRGSSPGGRRGRGTRGRRPAASAPGRPSGRAGRPGSDGSGTNRSAVSSGRPR